MLTKNSKQEKENCDEHDCHNNHGLSEGWTDGILIDA